MITQAIDTFNSQFTDRQEVSKAEGIKLKLTIAAWSIKNDESQPMMVVDIGAFAAEKSVDQLIVI